MFNMRICLVFLIAPSTRAREKICVWGKLNSVEEWKTITAYPKIWAPIVGRSRRRQIGGKMRRDNGHGIWKRRWKNGTVLLQCKLRSWEFIIRYFGRIMKKYRWLIRCPNATRPKCKKGLKTEGKQTTNSTNQTWEIPAQPPRLFLCVLKASISK